MKKALVSYLFTIQSVIFIFLSLSFILPSGNFTCIQDSCSLSIGSWHLHDSLWHLSLVNLGFGSWPLQNPFLAGETLSGYNFLLDYLLYLLKLIGVSPLFSFFKLIPIVAVCLYVYSVRQFLKVWTESPLYANLLAFFFYFGSSMSYLATLFTSQTLHYATLRGFPVVTSIHPSTMTLNLQFAFSLSIILWIMVLLRRPQTSWRAIILGFLYFLLFGFKFYGGVVALILLIFLLPKVKDLIAVAIFSLTSLVIFYGLGKGSNFPFTYAPFALTHLLIDDPLLFYNHSLTLARYYLYENLSGISPRLIFIESLSILLFLLLNFGTRLLSFVVIIKRLIAKTFTSAELGISLIILITALIPIFFVQNGGWYNTMQFLYYGVWLSSILMADFLYHLLKSNFRFKYFVFALIILLTVPNIMEQSRYLTAEQEVITADELAALEILASATPGVVHIHNPEHKNALVPALAEKPTYYLDTDQLMVTNSPYLERLEFIKKYSGGSITTVPANYYLVYKDEVGSPDAIRALTSPSQYELIYDSPKIALYHKI